MKNCHTGKFVARHVLHLAEEPERWRSLKEAVFVASISTSLATSRVENGQHLSFI